LSSKSKTVIQNKIGISILSRTKVYVITFLEQ